MLGLTIIKNREPGMKPANIFLASLTTQGGRRVTKQALGAIANIVGFEAETMPWASLKYAHTQYIRSELIAKYAPNTCNRFLSALRGVLRECWRLGYMSAEDYQHACDLRSVRGETLPAGRGLAEGEILALVQACQRDASPAGVRDAAIIGILYTCGLRRAELVSLELADLDIQTGAVKVLGKRHKERMVYIVGGALDALHDWLVLRGREAGALFQPVNKGSNIVPRGMTAHAIYSMLSKRGAEAQVASFSPHDLRRSFISDLLDAGADISTVAKMAGHYDVRTTMRYDRRPEEVKQKAAALLHLPYQSKGDWLA
jgi:site-specific recombinase XerD